MADPAGFAPTHRVVPDGAAWWAEPQPDQQPQGRLDPALPVEVVTVTTGWAQVRCSNGWECWVDARFLAVGAEETAAMPAAAGATAAPPAPAGRNAPWPDLSFWCSLVGAVLAAAGGALPWFSAGPVDVTAWDLRVVSLATGDPTDVAIDAGPVLLVVVLVLIPLLTRRALPAWAVMTLMAVPLLLAFMAFVRFADADPQPDLGVGLIMTAIGAVLMGISALLSPRLLPRPLLQPTSAAEGSDGR